MAGASKPHKSMIGIFKKVITTTTTKLEKTKLKGMDISLHLVAQPDCRRLKELGSYRTRILIIVFALIPCKANGCRTGLACPFASCVANQGHTVIQCHTIHQCMMTCFQTVKRPRLLLRERFFFRLLLDEPRYIRTKMSWVASFHLSKSHCSWDMSSNSPF